MTEDTQEEKRPRFATNQMQLGKLLRPTRVRKTINRAMRHPNAPGKTVDDRYDVAAWQKFFDEQGTVGHIDERQREGRSSEPAGIEAVLKNARIRQATADAERQEMENQEARGELVRKSEVVTAVAKVFADLKTVLLRIPPQLAPVIVAKREPAEIQALLAETIIDALKLLSDPRVLVEKVTSDGK
jgi:hypothetical protein